MLNCIDKYFWYIFLVLFLARTPWSLNSNTNQLKERFMKRFNDTCLKYPFVHQYWDALEQPPEDSVVFVYHEPGLRNGGVGDRLGGLINAAMMALRFNRSLLIQSGNGFDKLFRPFRNPSSFQVDIDTFYSNNPDSKFTYSKWTSWTNYKPELSNNDKTELDLWNCINNPSWNDVSCGQDWGMKEPKHIIKLRGNRAYVCKWNNNQQLPASRDLRKLGISFDSDLFEAAGCILRLVMWPTELLWMKVEEYLEQDLDKMNKELANRNDKLMNNDQKSSPFKFDSQTKMIGMHYRCGDHSYKSPAFANRRCQHDGSGNDPHPESEYMRFGTPIDSGVCAKTLIDDLLLTEDLHKNILVYIASDNAGSAEQMRDISAWNYSIISPHGCHVELDQSEECTTLTLVNWLVLALSDKIVTQTEHHCPISAFSRYAAVYGLASGNVLQNVFECTNTLPHRNISYIQNGNWFCR